MDLGSSLHEEWRNGYWALGATQETCSSSDWSRPQATNKEEATLEAKAKEFKKRNFNLRRCRLSNESGRPCKR